MFANKTMVVTKDGNTFWRNEPTRTKFGIRPLAQMIALGFLMAVLAAAITKGVIDLYVGWMTDDDRSIISASGCFILAVLTCLVEWRASQLMTPVIDCRSQRPNQPQVQQHQQQRPPQ